MNEVTNEQFNKKWHEILFNIFAAIYVLTFISEWLLLGTAEGKVEFEADRLMYMVKKIIIPTVMAFAIVVCTGIMIKSEKYSIEKKNWFVSIMIFFSLAIAAHIHFKFLPIILFPSAAIVATAVFADNNITIAITCLSLVSTAINNVRVMGVYDWKRSDMIKNLIMAMVMNIGVCVLVMVINKHTSELLESIRDGNQKQKSLSAEMKKDPMTGLYNRRSFEESLEEEIENVKQTGEDAFIAIFDIDHFKNVNDTYGHANGDIVIKALCKMMKDKSKEHGIAFRYGGEEFVILFRNIELPKVLNIVEDIRTEFRCYYFQFMLKDGITCSCGIAQYQAGESPKAWFNRADNSLYNAKESGRNRTVISE